MATLETLTPPSEENQKFANIKQQELEELVELDRHVLCAPAALLNLAREDGYSIDAREFAENLDWSRDWNEDILGWSRAGLSKMAREKYGIKTVSWWTSYTGHHIDSHDVQSMCQTGYLSDDPSELAFFDDVVSQQAPGIDGVLQLVMAGHKVITTVRAKFATNQAPHAIILEKFDPEADKVTIYDPDDRNSRSLYSREEIEAGVAPNGACTVMLPR